jgi:hypothetical protein
VFDRSEPHPVGAIDLDPDDLVVPLPDRVRTSDAGASSKPQRPGRDTNRGGDTRIRASVAEAGPKEWAAGSSPVVAAEAPSGGAIESDTRGAPPIGGGGQAESGPPPSANTPPADDPPPPPTPPPPPPQEQPPPLVAAPPPADVEVVADDDEDDDDIDGGIEPVAADSEGEIGGS